jgi:hypothetical protein
LRAWSGITGWRFESSLHAEPQALPTVAGALVDRFGELTLPIERCGTLPATYSPRSLKPEPIGVRLAPG